jgi:hypothetical protein
LLLVRWLFVVGGSVVLFLTLIDIVWTTLGTHGGGPVSKYLSAALWHCALALHRRKPNHRLLSFGGSVILVAVVLFWLIAVWAAWVLIFTFRRDSVIETVGGAPADVFARIYFIGYTMFTVGNGDLHPNGPLWRVATSLVGGSGLGSVTLAITFLLEVLAAVVQQRTLGAYITDLGATADKIITRAWSDRFESLQQHFVQLTGMIQLFTEQHLAYPVLHYFHSEKPRTSAALGIAVLHETVMLLADGVRVDARMPPAVTEPLRGAMQGFAQVISRQYVDPERQPPPAPSLHGLRAAGIPTVDDEAFRECVQQERKIRRFLLGLLHDDGWDWSDVTTARPA